MTKREAKERAQDLIMDQVANTLVAYQDAGDTDPQVLEEIRKQADRVAKLFGFAAAWHN